MWTEAARSRSRSALSPASNPDRGNTLKLQKLPPGQRAHLAPFFSSLTYENALLAGLVGGDLGVVFVDNTDAPSFALMQVGDMSYLGGHSATAEAVEAVSKHLRETRYVCIAQDDWHPLLEAYFRVHAFPTQVLEGSFMTLDEAIALKEQLPEGFRLERMDEARAAQLESDRVLALAPWWKDPAHFYAGGFGYVAVEEATGSVVCSMHTALVHGMRIKGYIQTHKDYRRRGLTLPIVGAFIEHCRKNGGYKSWWNATNEASVELAKKLKFRPHGEYTVYRLRPKPKAGQRRLMLKKREP